jgi:formylglycine-generating enzyme required for sulfatase activity
LPPDERARRLPAVPSKLSGRVVVTPDPAGHWRLELQPEDRPYAAGWGQPFVYTGRTHQVVQDWRRFPVLGVSGQDATAYAGWLDRTGRVPGARVCSEVEWERAARGADGRGYPAGHTIEPDEANVDTTHEPGPMGPDEVGSHPASRSPFGVDDMCGNALEPTLSEQGGYVLRSGSYQHDRRSAHLTNRFAMQPMVRDAALGMRLCATPLLRH